MKRFLLWLPVPLLALGCSRVGHFKDATAEAATDGVCSLLGADRDAYAKAEAEKIGGVSVAQVLDGISKACALRPGATSEDVELQTKIIAAGPR